ncbi:MAG: glutaredoxin [Deltaproteobacteria bacterium]|nr:glutaredoxin [Deltaproteobacteria bacterium]
MTSTPRLVRIYTTAYCGFCHRAKHILASENVAFEEVAVDGDNEKRKWLREKSGQRTVPQIFFGDESIGGCSELEVLVARKTLQQKLQG